MPAYGLLRAAGVSLVLSAAHLTASGVVFAQAPQPPPARALARTSGWSSLPTAPCRATACASG